MNHNSVGFLLKLLFGRDVGITEYCLVLAYLSYNSSCFNIIFWYVFLYCVKCLLIVCDYLICTASHDRNLLKFLSINC